MLRVPDNPYRNPGNFIARRANVQNVVAQTGTKFLNLPQKYPKFQIFNDVTRVDPSSERKSAAWRDFSGI
jgi:hypothetical protein